MAALELQRLTDEGFALNETMTTELGAPITNAEVALLTEHDDAAANLFGAVTQENEIYDQAGNFTHTAAYSAFNAVANIRNLRVGLGYGLFDPKRGVMPALVSPRSRLKDSYGQPELHILYLAEEGIPPTKIGDSNYMPTALQISILQGVNPYQDRATGSQEADNRAATASEGGHAMLALRSLTHEGVRDAVIGGRHIVHDLAKAPRGIMPVFSNRDQGTPGMLSLAGRDIVPDEKVVKPYDEPVLLIDHESYRAISKPMPGLEAPPDLMVAGLGVMAAKSQLGIDDSHLRDRILRIAERI